MGYDANEMVGRLRVLLAETRDALSKKGHKGLKERIQKALVDSDATQRIRGRPTFGAYYDDLSFFRDSGSKVNLWQLLPEETRSRLRPPIVHDEFHVPLDPNILQKYGITVNGPTVPPRWGEDAQHATHGTPEEHMFECRLCRVSVGNDTQESK